MQLPHFRHKNSLSDTRDWLDVTRKVFLFFGAIAPSPIPWSVEMARGTRRNVRQAPFRRSPREPRTRVQTRTVVSLVNLLREYFSLKFSPNDFLRKVVSSFKGEIMALKAVNRIHQPTLFQKIRRCFKYEQLAELANIFSKIRLFGDVKVVESII